MQSLKLRMEWQAFYVQVDPTMKRAFQAVQFFRKTCCKIKKFYLMKYSKFAFLLQFLFETHFKVRYFNLIVKKKLLGVTKK